MRRSSQIGTTFVEVLVGGAILLVVLSASSSFLVQAFRANAGVRAALLRDRIHDRVDRAATSEANIRNTVVTIPNTPLWRCINQSGAPDCVVTEVANVPWAPFQLLDNRGAWIAGVDGTGQPRRYGLDEQPCTAINSGCPFEAHAFFRATCEGGAAACDQAVTLSLRTELRVANDPAIPGKKLSIGGGGAIASTRVNQFKSSLATRDVAGQGQKDCAPGTVYRGVDRFGNVRCATATQSTACTSMGLPNQFVTSVDFNNRQFGCATFQLQGSCDVNSHLTGHNPDGSPVCGATTVPDSSIAAVLSTAMQAGICPPGQTMHGRAANGNPVCKLPQVATGSHSYVDVWAPTTHISTFVFPTTFKPVQAGCWVQNTHWFREDLAYGNCNCTNAIPNFPGQFVSYISLTYHSNHSVNPASDGCSFAYFVVGFPE